MSCHRCLKTENEEEESAKGTMMLASGFRVYDLDVDVVPETFVEKVQETDADLVGLSALLTTTMTAQRDVLEALQEAGIRDRVKVIWWGVRQ